MKCNQSRPGLETRVAVSISYDDNHYTTSTSITGLNSEFSFSLTSCLTKAEEPSLPCYLPIPWGRIIGFIPFPRVLELCEMQSVSSRFWTRVAVSISYDDNHYTTGTSLFCLIYLRYNIAYRNTWMLKGKRKLCTNSFIITTCHIRKISCRNVTSDSLRYLWNILKIEWELLSFDLKEDHQLLLKRKHRK